MHDCQAGFWSETGSKLKSGRVPLLAGITFAVMLTLCSVVNAAPFETSASEAYVVEAETGTVLLEKNADKPVPPASMAKMMTIAVVFDAIKAGRLSLDDEFTVSEHAWQTGGAPSRTSTMFAAIKSSIRVDDLLKGVMVQGANDGCIVLAEGMVGSEEKFVELMNARALELGLNSSKFANSTGLPADGQAVTMRDLVRLARYLATEHSSLFAYYALPEFTWNKILQRNRNPLLRMDIGADGVLTGYTERSGYSIVGSMRKDGKRVFAALGGMKDDKERAQESRKLFEWISSSFQNRQVFKAGELVGRVPVFAGARPDVALRSEVPVRLLLNVEDESGPTAEIVYAGPLAAPVSSGDAVGILRFRSGDHTIHETPLVAAEDVPIGSLEQRAFHALEELTVGWLRNL